MKTLILYKTKWGSTHEYCEYIHSKVPNSDIFSINEFNMLNLHEYQTVIIGSRVFMGNIEAVSFLTKNWKDLKTKSIYLFAVGLIERNNEASIASYNKIPEEIRNSIKYIKVMGKVETPKLNFVEKMAYNMVKSSVEKKGKEFKANKMDLDSVKPVIEFALAH